MLNINFLSLGRKVMLPALFVVIALLGVNFLFSQIQNESALANLNRVEAIFQNNNSGSNPYLVLNDLLEMRARDLIDCISLDQKTPVEHNFISSPNENCDVSLLTLNAKKIDSVVGASSGSQWRVQFNSKNPSKFSELLWLVRTLVVSLIILFFVAVRQREKRFLESSRLKLEHQERINTLAREVAHDIRSPLSALRLLLSADSASGEKQALALSALNRINVISQNLLDRSRSSITFRFCLHDLEKVLDSVIAEVSHHDRKITFSKNLTVVDWSKNISLDQSALERILTNLIYNSIEASGDKGKITIIAHANPTDLEIQLIDEGHGFPADFSLDKTHSVGKLNGNGLGLSQAKRIIAEVGGQLSIQNLPVGAKVSIILPLS